MNAPRPAYSPTAAGAGLAKRRPPASAVRQRQETSWGVAEAQRERALDLRSRALSACRAEHRSNSNDNFDSLTVASGWRGAQLSRRVEPKIVRIRTTISIR